MQFLDSVFFFFNIFASVSSRVAALIECTFVSKCRANYQGRLMVALNQVILLTGTLVTNYQLTPM